MGRIFCVIEILAVENFQRLAPRRLLAVIDLAQIDNTALHYAARL
jgi:hypothetical protein